MATTTPDDKLSLPSRQSSRNLHLSHQADDNAHSRQLLGHPQRQDGHVCPDHHGARQDRDAHGARSNSCAQRSEPGHRCRTDLHRQRRSEPGHGKGGSDSTLYWQCASCASSAMMITSDLNAINVMSRLTSGQGSIAADTYKNVRVNAQGPFTITIR